MGFGALITILRARARLIVLCVVAAVAAAFAAAMLLPARYEAEASVMVRPEGMDLGAGGNVSRANFDRLESIVSTHVDLIASRAVALQVVERLGLESDADAMRLHSGAGPLNDVRDWIADLRRLAADLFTGGRAVREEVSRSDRIAGELLRDLTLKSNRDSRLIRIGFASAHPEFSSRVANAFAQAYLDTLVRLRVRPAREGSRWLDERTRELRQDLEQAEARLAKFQQDKGIVASDERLDLETGRLNELSAQLAVVQSESYASRARQRQFREFLRDGREPPAEVLASAGVQQLKRSVADREAKLAEMSRRYGPNHPQFRAARTELQDLKRQLNEQMRITGRSLLASGGVSAEQEASLRDALDRQRTRVLALKGDRRQLAILTREVDNAQRAYGAAAQRLSQLKLESEVDQATGAIVAAAPVPNRPAGPSRRLFVLAALVGGLALGIGAALVLEANSRYIRSERDLGEVVGIPVLAVLDPKAGRRRGALYLKSPNVYSLPKA